MPNSLGGINLAQIAQESLKVLSPKLVLLKNFTRDFSSDIAVNGQSVTTRVATDEDADDVSGGFSASDATSTPYTITLNQELGKVKGFTQKELSLGGMDLLRRTFFPSMVNAVGKGVIKYCIGLMTNATFANKTVITAGNFDADAVADLGGNLDALNVPDDNRSIIVQPAYTTNLVKDDTIQRVDASGSDMTLRESRIGHLHGFNISKFNAFPSSGTTNAENLMGFACSNEGILIAARFPDVPDAANQVIDVENVVEPESGFPMQFQLFYVPMDRKFYIAIATLFGAQPGVPNNLWRIVSA